MLYLGYGRNAWHSTWINRYYPGSISFFEKDLQALSERHRVQGSVFRIEPIPVVYLEYCHDVILLLVINDRPAAAYQPLLENIVPFRLNAFWTADEFMIDNWLLTFVLPAWRPDLYPKSYHRMSSSPRQRAHPRRQRRRSSERRVQAYAADGVTGPARDRLGGDTDERVRGRHVGGALVGVVPVDPGTRGPCLRADLGDVEDADECGLDGLAEGGGARGDAEDGADEQAIAGGDGIGRNQGDGVAGLDVVFHGEDPRGKTKGGPIGPPACQGSTWGASYAPGFL